VERLVLAGGERSWTVLGGDHRPVGPAEEFLEYLRVQRVSPNTVKSYARALALWWQYLQVFGLAWDAVTLEAVGGFLAWLRTGDGPQVVSIERRAARFAESTIAARLQAVMSCYRYHQFNGGGAWPGPNPPGAWSWRQLQAGAGASGPAHGPPPGGDRGSAAGKSGAAVADAGTDRADLRCVRGLGCGDLPLAGMRARPAAVDALAESGLRLGEALGLQHRDWHAGCGDTAFIEVVPRDHPHGVRVKGGGYRRLYVSDGLDRLYGEYVWQLCEAGADLAAADLDETCVFVNLSREPQFAPWRPESVYDLVQRLRRQLAGQVPAGWTPHWFRHSHASALLLAGVPVHVVSRRLGHADVQTTLNVYGHVTEDAELQAAADWKALTGRWLAASLEDDLAGACR